MGQNLSPKWHVAKGSTFYGFLRKSVIKGSEGFTVLHTGGVEVGSSNLPGPTIFTLVFRGPNAFLRFSFYSMC